MINYIGENEQGLTLLNKLNSIVDIVNLADTLPIFHYGDVSIIVDTTHIINLTDNSDYNINIGDLVANLIWEFTLGGDAQTLKRSANIEIDNSLNTQPVNFTFNGNWDWAENVKPTGMASGSRAMLYLETRKTKVFACYTILG